jgi:hypothetical protein
MQAFDVGTKAFRDYERTVQRCQTSLAATDWNQNDFYRHV